MVGPNWKNVVLADFWTFFPHFSLLIVTVAAEFILQPMRFICIHYISNLICFIEN